jgi:hypothetical protein
VCEGVKKESPWSASVNAIPHEAANVSTRLVNDAVRSLVADPGRLILAYMTRRRRGTLPASSGPESITARPSAKPTRRASAATSGRPGADGYPSHLGVVALPLLAWLHVRAGKLPRIDPKHGPQFQTKLEMGVELKRGPGSGSGSWACRCRWWSTGSTPRGRSSSRRCRWP